MRDNHADACLRLEPVMRLNTRTHRTAAALLVGVLAGAVVGAQPSRSALADYAGTWQLDERSTTAPEKPPGEEGRGDAGGGRGGGSGVSITGLGTMTAPGSISGPPDRDKIARHRRIAQAELAAPRQIVVSAEGQSLIVSMDGGRPETIEPDGKRHLRLTGDGEIQTVTRWHEGALVSERHYDEGITATRTYTIDAADGGAKRLTVTLRLSGGLTPKKMPEVVRFYLLK
jgi:hypothetical protein